MKISSKQTSLFTEDKSTSSQQASPVSLSQEQVKDLERRTTVIYGRRIEEPYGRHDPPGLSLKMFLVSLLGKGEWHSNRFALIWSRTVTRYNRFLFRLSRKEHPTNANGSGLLLTPSTMLLPTPSTKNVSGGAVILNEKGNRIDTKGREWKGQLHDLAKSGMLPTPAARDVKGANSLEHMNKENGNSVDHIGQLPNYLRYHTGESSQLSPLFVSEMMGFPTDYLVLPFQNGEMRE